MLAPVELTQARNPERDVVGSREDIRIILYCIDKAVIGTVGGTKKGEKRSIVRMRVC